MLKRQHYESPPITEAVIDIRVDVSPEITSRDLLTARQGVEDEYPNVMERKSAFGKMDVGPQVTAVAGTKMLGYMFSNHDETYLYQARIDGFTLSRLKSYDSWERFRDEAKKLWAIYKKVSNPNKVTRQAVRYINKIDIPLPLRDFDEYLRTLPVVSKELPQGLSGYLMQLAMPLEDIRSTALISQTIVNPSAPNVVSIVLDIDVFCDFDLKNDEDEIWGLLDVLHGRENYIFEACITDKARELFKPCLQ